MDMEVERNKSIFFFCFCFCFVFDFVFHPEDQGKQVLPGHPSGHVWPSPIKTAIQFNMLQVGGTMWGQLLVVFSCTELEVEHITSFHCSALCTVNTIKLERD